MEFLQSYRCCKRDWLEPEIRLSHCQCLGMAISTRWFFMTIRYGTRASGRLGGEILKLCVKVGGSISGEHGVGADKRCYMPNMFTEVDLETMQWVRGAFNPKGLANPGKIFSDAPHLWGSCRYDNLSRWSGLDNSIPHLLKASDIQVMQWG